MRQKIIGLYSTASWGAMQEASRKKSRSPLGMYRRAVQYKANPRDEAYMKSLFDSQYPGAPFVNVQQDNSWRALAGSADAIVLLYPDSIGFGFSRLEKEVWRLKTGWAEVRVLNGRRRDFLLNRTTLRALRARRWIEQLMLAEFLMTAIFVCVTPLLLMADFLRGRR